MQKTYSITFENLYPIHTDDLIAVREKLLDLRYNEDQGYGFRNITLNDNLLTATLLKRIPTFISQYDFRAGKFIEQKIYLFTQIDFIIDSKYKLLQIFGPVKNVTKLKSAIRPLLEDVSSTGADLSPCLVLPKITHQYQNTIIDRLVINNFQFAEGISGRYEITATNSLFAVQLLEKYSHDVSKARIEINDRGKFFFKVLFTNNSQLLIRCDESQFEEVHSGLKEVLFSERKG